MPIYEASKRNIEKAAKLLINGEVVIFPTETVYGLGANAENRLAVQEIYRIKKRPNTHPLIVHVVDLNALNYWSQKIPKYALSLAENFWPGPMTLILPKSQEVKDFISVGQQSIGLRIPDHPVARELLMKFGEMGGKGVAAPSVNIFGAVSATTAQNSIYNLKDLENQNLFILEGGESEIGIESTIINCLNPNPEILRPGAISINMIESVTKTKVKDSQSKIQVSGSFDKHYSPKAKVILDVDPVPGDGFIALEKIPTPEGVVRLMSPKDEIEFAHQLYLAFVQADILKLERIVVSVPESGEISIAIKDRLIRAAN